MMRIQHLFTTTVVVVALAVAGTVHAASQAEPLFSVGMRQYQADAYEQAVTTFEQATRSEPRNSEYFRWLGRSYGRLAEHSSWLRAPGLALKARNALERAVELDATNVGALEDLMEYYGSAPSFLGGSEEKAEAIRKRLLALRASTEGARLSAPSSDSL
jgi:tetratricopeptide (TPR) repeat protein